MKQIFNFILFSLIPLAAASQKVLSLTIDGTINPATADFIHKGIKRAYEEKAQCLIIHLNTPGGLMKSTRVIVSDILDSPVPVAVFVSPPGAHAGSAGVFITMAAHIAAMAPGTNMGAAHPVTMGNEMDSIMNEKTTNDAAAFIRTIAEKRNRNLEWAELAVRKSVSLSANEALQKNVIDVVALNDRLLLRAVDGRTIELNTQVVKLATKDVSTETIEMGLVEKILNIISDPNIAYILLMLGFYGVLFELYSPGTILPGIIGVISLILAFYGMHTLPVNYAGVALIAFAIILFLLEIKIVSHGLLAIGGIVSLLIGSMIFIREDSDEFSRISWTVIIASVAVTSLFFLFVIGLGLKAQKLRPTTGIEAMKGEIGVALEILDPKGTARVRGEIWQAESIAGTIQEGEKIRIVSIENLKLFVEPLTNSS